jgi:hypothetical protein
LTITLPKVIEDENSQEFFKYYPSDKGILEVRDDTGKLLVVMFPLSVEKVKTLMESESLLCPSSEVRVGKNYEWD